MTYWKPEDVDAPKKRWKEGHSVLFNTGRDGWSAAEGAWDDEPVIALRWNGSDDDPGPGSPQSRGYPTWFIVPDELAGYLKDALEKLKEERDGIQCDVESPSNYDAGAWRIKVVLSEKKGQLAGKNFKFSYPKVQNRMFKGDTGFSAVVNVEPAEIGGQFVDGVWDGHFYAYDLITKDESVRNDIRQILVESLAEQIRRIAPNP